MGTVFCWGTHVCYVHIILINSRNEKTKWDCLNGKVSHARRNPKSYLSLFIFGHCASKSENTCIFLHSNHRWQQTGTTGLEYKLVNSTVQLFVAVTLCIQFFKDFYVVWLSGKVLSKLSYAVPKTTVKDISECKPGVIEVVLANLRMKVSLALLLFL